MANRPVYLLIDVSEKMRGEPFEATQTALDTIAASLKTVVASLDISLCVITFASSTPPKVLRPLSAWSSNDTMPELTCLNEPAKVDSGLECLLQNYSNDISKHEGSPLLIFITSGDVPSQKLQDDLKQCGFGRIWVIYHQLSLLDKGRVRPLDEFYRLLTFDHKQFGELSSNDFAGFWDDTAVIDIDKVKRRGWDFKEDHRKATKEW